jgi:hypothetical protein
MGVTLAEMPAFHSLAQDASYDLQVLPAQAHTVTQGLLIREPGNFPLEGNRGVAVVFLVQDEGEE